jgi:N-acetylmuramoyl-L-alanine amidase
VVLDLGSQVEFSASQLANPERLMVEVRLATDPALPALPSVTENRTPATRPVLLPPAAAAPRPEAAKVELPAPPVSVAAAPPASTAALPAMVPGGGPPTKAEPPKIERAKTELSRKLEPVKRIETAKADTKSALAEDSGSKTAKPLEPATTATRRSEVGKAARPTSEGGSSLTRALGLKLNRVVIDPGHGGHDQGTQGPRGLLEKDLVLDVAKRVGKLVEERMGAEVIYTRTDDTFIPLQDRTALANEKKADLFLSIHANSSRYARIAGVETYYLNFTDSQDAMEVAARENATSDKSIFELKDLIQKITLHEKVEESKEFASHVQTSLQAFESRSFPQSKNRGVKRAPFIVLIGAQMPSVLTEIGFLTNPREEALLKKADYRQKLANAIFRGISRYAQNLSHFQMAKAGED